MDVLKFVEERSRMCATYPGCKGCLLTTTACMNIVNITEQVVDIVEKWSAAHPAHPIKTRQSVFLEQYPNAKLDNQGILVFDPCDIDKTTHGKDCPNKSCYECRCEFWLQEVK